MTDLALKIIVCVLVGYFIGVVNPAFLLAKLKGFDIRTKGTGNAGASNATIVMGKSAGVFCALFDIIKAFAAARICGLIFPEFAYAIILGGTFCVLGHDFPVFMNFRGGKGTAAMAGAALAFDWKLFLILLLLEIVLVLVKDYLCLVPTTGSFLFTVIIGFRYGILFALIFLPVFLVSLVKHLENFRNMKYGIEYRIRFFWKREEEKQRVQANRDKLTEEQKKKFLKEQ